MLHWLYEWLHLNPIIKSNPLLLASLLMFAASGLLAVFKRYTPAIIFLTAGSFMLNYFVIHLDPYLNGWDERFHALVAKNMAAHPFSPMLYVNPVLPFDYRSWGTNHIWLHKQPLFLWQIALCIKMFGNSVFAVRLPSAVMLTMLCPVIYRMGKLLVNRNTGYIAALLCVSNNYILEHVSGKQQIEHNDVAFMFYVSLSIWAWLEHERSGKKGWLIAAGFFSGCAILVKWLVGLLFYAGYSFYHIVVLQDFFKKENLVNLLQSLFCTLLVAVPWQVYIFVKYPTEAAWEYTLNRRHFTEVVEGHSGPLLFYINDLHNLYRGAQLIVLLGLFAAIIYSRRQKLILPLLALVVIVYLFFTIAATKMSSFVMPVQPIIFLMMAIGLNYVFRWLKLFPRVAPVLGFLILAILTFQNLDISRIAGNHRRNPENYWGRWMQNAADNTILYKNLKAVVPANYVIAYCNEFEEIDCMYFSGITSYSWLDENKFNQLKALNVGIAVFKNKLPDFVLHDSTVLQIPLNYKISPPL